MRKITLEKGRIQKKLKSQHQAKMTNKLKTIAKYKQVSIHNNKKEANKLRAIQIPLVVAILKNQEYHQLYIQVRKRKLQEIKSKPE